jgi:hypothetical protein
MQDRWGYQGLSALVLKLTRGAVQVEVMSVPSNTEYMCTDVKQTSVVHTVLTHFQSRRNGTNQKEETERSA